VEYKVVVEMRTIHLVASVMEGNMVHRDDDDDVVVVAQPLYMQDVAWEGSNELEVYLEMDGAAHLLWRVYFECLSQKLL
jgi:hypothetical protein